VRVLAVVRDRIGTRGVVDGVRTGAAIEDVYFSVVRLLGRTPAHQVIAAPSEDRIRALMAFDPVLAHLAVNLIVARTAFESIVAFAAEHLVVPFQRVDYVDVGAAEQSVRHTGAAALAVSLLGHRESIPAARTVAVPAKRAAKQTVSRGALREGCLYSVYYRPGSRKL
jgi:hypothetical protein